MKKAPLHTPAFAQAVKARLHHYGIWEKIGGEPYSPDTELTPEAIKSADFFILGLLTEVKAAIVKDRDHVS